MIKSKYQYGFTIVELLVTIVIIGILSTLAFVSYRGVSQKAITASIESDLQNISKQIRLYEVDNGVFPTSINDCPTPSAGNMCLKTSNGNTFTVNVIDNTAKIFCVSIENGDQRYFITDNNTPTKGVCLSANVNILVVGGGGSGATSSTGGTGGSGGSVVVSNGISVKNTTTDIVVGDGGLSASSDSNGAVGSNSSFGNYVIANGGSGGVTGSSSSAPISGTVSTISGSSVIYGGGGGSSNSDYEKTVGGTGGGGGGVPSSAYGDGSKNTITNGYAGLIHGFVSDHTLKSFAGNYYGLSAYYGDFEDETHHLPLNNGQATAALASSTTNSYTLNPQVAPGKQIKIGIRAGGFTTAVSTTGLYLVFGGLQKTLSQAVAEGYIEPMVLIGSGSYFGSYYWPNVLNLYTSTATSNGTYPDAGIVVTLKKYPLTGLIVNTNKAFNSTYDGIRLDSHDRTKGLSLSPLPSLNGTHNTGGGGSANTAEASGAGGSGVVIVSYPTGSVSATGGTITTSGGNTIHTFTSNGTFTIVE